MPAPKNIPMDWDAELSAEVKSSGLWPQWLGRKQVITAAHCYEADWDKRFPTDPSDRAPMMRAWEAVARACAELSQAQSDFPPGWLAASKEPGFSELRSEARLRLGDPSETLKSIPGLRGWVKNFEVLIEELAERLGDQSLARDICLKEARDSWGAFARAVPENSSNNEMAERVKGLLLMGYPQAVGSNLSLMEAWPFELSMSLMLQGPGLGLFEQAWSEPWRAANQISLSLDRGNVDAGSSSAARVMMVMLTSVRVHAPSIEELGRCGSGALNKLGAMLSATRACGMAVEEVPPRFIRGDREALSLDELASRVEAEALRRSLPQGAPKRAALRT